MKKRLLAAGLVAVAAGALGLSVFLVHRAAKSADHLDSPAVVADPTVDIADVYSWMDGSNFVAAMTLYPNAPSSAMFSNSAQYVIHTASGSSFTAGTTNSYDIICTFDGNTPQNAQCWAGNNEYATGNAGQSNGISSADGKFKVFAGLRADPFHFNLAGFKAAVGMVETLTPPPTVTSDAGCPYILPSQASAIVNQLSHNVDGGTAVDFFATLNALAVVVSLDKSLVTAGGNIVSVWGATLK